MKAIKKAFRAAHGELDDGKTCGTCGKCIRMMCGKRNVYKCVDMGISASAATDIRLKDKACDLWEEALPY